MKKIMILFFYIFYNVFLLLALDIDYISKQLKNLKILESEIRFKELEISKLKLKSTNNPWDFVNRRTNEQIIQKRSNKMRELNNLYVKQQQIIDDLLDKRKEIIKNIDKHLDNSIFIEILNSLDDLQYNRIIQQNFDIKIPKNTEFNKVNIDLLQSKHKEIENFLHYLDLKQKLLEKAKIFNFNELITKQKDNLKSKFDKLDNLIKNLSNF